MRVIAIVRIGAAALLMAAGGALAADPDEVERLIVDKTNAFRREQGLEPLSRNARLERAARYFVEYMARHDRYGHTADGTEPADRAQRLGYDWCLISENISYQYSSGDFGTRELAERYMEGWKASPGHRKNMVAPHVVDIAVAVARSDKTRRYYAVQMFGRPRSTQFEFRISSRARDSVRYQVDGETFTLPAGAARIHTLCTPEEVVLEAPGRARARPSNGDRLAVVREAGRLQLKRD